MENVNVNLNLALNLWQLLLDNLFRAAPKLKAESARAGFSRPRPVGF